MSPSVRSPLHSRRQVLAALVSACLPLPLMAQDIPIPANMGFFRLVNAIGLPGVLKLKVDGISPRPAGFKEGEATGAVGLEPKSYQVELEHEALGTQSVTVNVQTGMISTLVAYKTEKPEKDPKTGKIKAAPAGEKPGPRIAWCVDEAPISQVKLNQPKLTVLQVTANEKMDFKVEKTPVTALAAKPTLVEITKAIGAFPEVRVQDKFVCGLNFDSPADQLVVFFAGSDGLLKFAVTHNDVM